MFFRSDRWFSPGPGHKRGVLEFVTQPNAAIAALILLAFAASAPALSTDDHRTGGHARSPQARAQTLSYRLMEAAGFGHTLKRCDEYPSTLRRACEQTHSELDQVLSMVTVSRRDDAPKFEIAYFNRTFDRLIECLRTSCSGQFYLTDNSGSVWATRWSTMLAFQACIYAIPAVEEISGKPNKAFVALYRFDKAIKGGVNDCPPDRLSDVERSVLRNFNLAGVY